MKNANPLSKLTRSPGLLVTALLLVVATVGAVADTGTKSTPKTVADYFAVKVGAKELRLQIAVTSPELQKGLMFRRSLKPDEGMLFVFEHPQEMSFYMRNTSVPLHIGYFDPKGVLCETYPLYPFDETPVRSRSEELQFALEVNQGWYHENQVRAGAKLDLTAVRAALEARGFRPADYGMGK